MAPLHPISAEPLVRPAAAVPQCPPGQPLPAGRRTISCVIPCFNEAVNLDALLQHLQEVLAETSLAWEILVVDDGSTDHTPAIARAWSQRQGFRFLALSRNFGKEAALTAGLKAARGDAVIFLDGDLQHSPDLVDEMIRRWMDGADVVYTIRENRSDESWLKRFCSGIFYRLLKTEHRFKVHENAGDFRLMDRKVVDALSSLPERTRFMKGLYAWVGFKAVALPYMPSPRVRGDSSYSLFQLIGLGFDALTAFTTWPLRMVSIVGFLLAFLAMGYGTYLTGEYWFEGNPVSGWSTIVVSLMFFMGIQMIFTGLLGEYIARIFDEVKGRPLYLVARDTGQGLPKDAE